MGELSQKNATVIKCVKKQDDMIFTMDDIRSIIQQKQQQEQEDHDQSSEKSIVEVKCNIIASKADLKAPQKIGAASIADILGFNPNIAKRTSTKDKNPLQIPEKYRKYYKYLLKMKFELEARLIGLPKGDMNDGIGLSFDSDVTSFDFEFAISLVPSEQEALAEVIKAIERIYNGTYGICEITGNSIEPERLETVPFTRFSLEGQQSQEKLKIAKKHTDGSLFESDQRDDGEPDDHDEE